MTAMTLLLLLSYSTSGMTEQSYPMTELESALRTRTNSLVYLRGSPGYETHRAVANGGCRHIYPAAVVRPRDTADVVEIVKVARELGVRLSVRSGGHSYQCQGTAQDSLNVDLRLLKKVKLVSPDETVLGAGNNWGDVLKVIRNDRHTLVHGQCLDVGVSGYLLGLGTNMNSISARYGSGADNVLQHTVVLASGEVAVVTAANTTILGPGPPRVIPHDYDTDLRFALRSSGSSFGITTEFRYRVHPGPEPLPMLVPLFIESSADFRNLERAAAQGRYGFLMLEPYYFRRPAITHLLANVYRTLPPVLRRLRGKPTDPVFFAVTDIKAVNRSKGDPAKALNFLKYFGLKLGMDDPGLMRTLGMDGFDLSFSNIESGYLTEKETKEEGPALLASANMFGLSSTKALESIFFTHPVFGRSHKHSSRGVSIGCDFCTWFIYLANPYVPLDPVPGDSSAGGNVITELTCSTDARDGVRSGKCAYFVKKLKERMVADARRAGEGPVVHQYVNTPSCDVERSGGSFQHRYWGSNYGRLVKLKEYWDPSNVFQHCQSVGSTDNDCCPI